MVLYAKAGSVVRCARGHDLGVLLRDVEVGERPHSGHNIEWLEVPNGHEGKRCWREEIIAGRAHRCGASINRQAVLDGTKNEERKLSKGWYGVDLDGTLAFYDKWRGIDHIGPPIMPMLDRVKRWLAEGKDVRIFTARVDGGEVALAMGDPAGEAHRDVAEVERHIRAWCLKHVGRELPVTCRKDYGMIELWDDRAVQVIPNTGVTIADELAAERSARAGKP